MKYFLLLLAVLFSSISFPLMSQDATEKDDAVRALWMKGFDTFEKAETTEKADDRKIALPLYQDSLICFQKVKAQYPKWNSDLVDYRIKICDMKIKELQANPAPTSASKVPAATPMEKKQSNVKPGFSEEQLRNLQDKLEKAVSENEVLRKKLKEMSDNQMPGELAKQLQSDNEKMKKEITALAADMEKESLERAKILQEKKEISGKLEKVESVLAGTKNENSKISAEIDGMKKKVVEVDASATTYQKDISDLSADNKSLKNVVNSLADSLDKVRKEKVDSERQLASLRNDLGAKAKDLESRTKELESISNDLSAKNEIARKYEELVKGNADIGIMLDELANLYTYQAVNNEELTVEIGKRDEQMKKKDEEMIIVARNAATKEKKAYESVIGGISLPPGAKSVPEFLDVYADGKEWQSVRETVAEAEKFSADEQSDEAARKWRDAALLLGILAEKLPVIMEISSELKGAELKMAEIKINGKLMKQKTPAIFTFEAGTKYKIEVQYAGGDGVKYISESETFIPESNKHGKRIFLLNQMH
ncbi:MAG TPA: hypothetical protein DCZ94_16395 [Lentisphaeria bacterium]|nr:MAG: hypothetical protein A2X48_01940 [Lentisphaerae bacterium GWF2_49_21]HBC88528.1 hypothetical protein [Lentisphaeria bacterium]